MWTDEPKNFEYLDVCPLFLFFLFSLSLSFSPLYSINQALGLLFSF